MYIFLSFCFTLQHLSLRLMLVRFELFIVEGTIIAPVNMNNM